MYSITVTEHATTPTITADNDLRIAIATSSVDMRWDPTYDSPSFSGSASSKVASSVTFEGGNSVVVIDVLDGQDFVTSDVLTISGLYFNNFNTVNSAISALDIFKGGAADIVSDADDGKTIAIKGTFAETSHEAGQESNQLNISGNSISTKELFNFKLAPHDGEDVDVTNLVISLSNIRGFETENITSPELFIDYNNDGNFDAGEDTVGGTGTVSIDGITGTITFSTDFTATTTRNYVLRANVSSVNPGNEMSIGLLSTNITSDGSTSNENLTTSGSLSGSYHAKTSGFKGGGTVGTTAESTGDVTSGTVTAGEIIGTEPGFMAPSSTGSPKNEWATPDSGYNSDSSYASTNVISTHQDYATFNFNITGNQIDGIEVKLEASADTSYGNIGAELSWNEGVTTTTSGITATTNLTTSDVIYTLGSPSNLWGRNPGDWVTASFNNTNFRLRVIGLPSGNIIYIDAIQVKIYNSTTGAPGDGGGGGI